MDRKGRVSIETDGKTYHASWAVEGKFLRVYTDLGEEVTQLGDSSPEPLARLILSELVTKGKA